MLKQEYACAGNTAVLSTVPLLFVLQSFSFHFVHEIFDGASLVKHLRPGTPLYLPVRNLKHDVLRAIDYAVCGCPFCRSTCSEHGILYMYSCTTMVETDRRVTCVR